jgi:4,5-dihydroxyphthalate decarboxylase
MPNVTINFACGLYDRVFPLYAGEVQPAGVDLKFVTAGRARHIFDRMAGTLEFEASELSASEFISRFSANQCPFVALPVFPSRLFRHSFIAVNRKSGIREPKDLEGKRVGVALYTMTAAIWIRGLLQHDYGVDLKSIRWVQGAVNSAGTHGTPTVVPMATAVPIEINRSGKSLSQLLDEGAIDAVMGTSLPDAMRHNPDIQRLFPRFRDVEKDYYLRTGIFPIMHVVVIRRDIHEAHPFVARSLYDALCESKALAIERMRSLGSLPYMLPWMIQDVEEMDEVFGADPFAYGVEPNRTALEALVGYMAEQGMIAAPVPVDRLFVPTDPQRT